MLRFPLVATGVVVGVRQPWFRVMQSIRTGFTRSRRSDGPGIAGYGVDPCVVPQGDPAGNRGNDAWISSHAIHRDVSSRLAIISAVVRH